MGGFRPVERIFEPSDLSSPPISVAVLREYLRVSHNTEDGLIGDLAAAATGHVERFIQQLLTRRPAVLRLPCLPPARIPIELPGGPVGAVTDFKVDGVSISPLPVAAGHSPALLMPATDWQVAVGTGYPVEINYTVGFAVIPAPLRVALMMVVADLYDRRGSMVDGNLSEAPVAAAALMRPFRVRPA